MSYLAINILKLYSCLRSFWFALVRNDIWFGNFLHLVLVLRSGWFIMKNFPSSISHFLKVIVQRALASRDMSHAKGACILAGYLKLLPLFIMIFPGMAARVLFPEEVACASPESMSLHISNLCQLSQQIHTRSTHVHVLPNPYKI